MNVSGAEALDYFMKTDQYIGFELPRYFGFDGVLDYVRKTVADRPYDDCLSGTAPESMDNVNLDILLNKDGRYAVRPLMIANPYLYYFLAREICSEPNWELLKRRFNQFSDESHSPVQSLAMPLIVRRPEPFYKSATILNWWQSLEQRSIELSLEYRYMFITDITNCYGSIDPQSFERALTCQGTTLEESVGTDLAHNIQRYIRAMQHGHNVGIPQGSALFDFVAEIVLGYSDLLLKEKIERVFEEKKINEKYIVLRYRDDYRIFCNNKDALDEISFALQSVLESLNFRMNDKKTNLSESLVTDAIKPDKLDYIYNTPIFNGTHCDFASFEKYLLYILLYGRDHQNSGQLKTLLSDLDKRLEKWIAEHTFTQTLGESIEIDDKGNVIKPEPKTDKKEEKKEAKVVKPSYIPGGSIRAQIAVATQIAAENVTVSHYALKVISRMLHLMRDNDTNKADIINLVYNKLCRQHNSDYNQLWLQHITYHWDKKHKSPKMPYTLRLCQLVMDKNTEPLWNNKWLKAELTKKFPEKNVVDKEILKNTTPVIDFKEKFKYDEWLDEIDE